MANLIPGEGYTEVNLQLKQKDKPKFSILALRDIDKQDSSNLFTQFSLSHSKITNKSRLIGNLGFGYRQLSADESLMLGINSFLDYDLVNTHARGSIGLEARASVLELNVNLYESLSLKKAITEPRVTDRDEETIGGIDYNLKTQVPYMPWATFSWTGYEWDAD